MTGTSPEQSAHRIPWGTLGMSLLSASLLLLFILPIFALVASVPLGRVLQAGSDPGVQAALAFTLTASALALIATLVLGVPLGYLFARHSFPGKPVVESVVTLPVVVPHLIAGLAIFFLFAPSAPLGALAIRAGFPVLETIWGVVLVMVYVSAPYTVLASQLAFRAVDPRLLESARALGATPRQSFWNVTLPLASRGILAGGLLSWARSVSEIGGFLIVAYTVYPTAPFGGPVTTPISVYVYNLYQLGDVPGAAAVAVLLVLVAFVLFLTIRLVERAGWFPWPRGALAL